MRTWPQIKSLRSRKIRKLEPCDRVKEWHKGSRTFLVATPHGRCGTSYGNHDKERASNIQFTYEAMWSLHVIGGNQFSNNCNPYMHVQSHERPAHSAIRVHQSPGTPRTAPSKGDLTQVTSRRAPRSSRLNSIPLSLHGRLGNRSGPRLIRRPCTRSQHVPGRR